MRHSDEDAGGPLGQTQNTRGKSRLLAPAGSPAVPRKVAFVTLVSGDGRWNDDGTQTNYMGN